MRGNMSTTTMIFILLLALVAFVYYKGASTDLRTASQGAQTLLYGFTARDPVTGNFESYPLG